MKDEENKKKEDVDWKKVLKLNKDDPHHYYRKLFAWPSRHIFLHLPLTPNQFTWISFAVSLFGIVLFLGEGYWYPILGTLMLFLGVFFDIVDGTVARYRKHFSNRTIDGNIGIYIRPLIFVFISLRLFLQTDSIFYIVLGFIILHSIAILAVFGRKRENISKSTEAISAHVRNIKTSFRYKVYKGLSKLLPTQQLFPILLIFSILNLLEIFLLIYTIDYLLLALMHTYNFVMYEQVNEGRIKKKEVDEL